MKLPNMAPEQQTTGITIAVVEDDPGIRESLIAFLKKASELKCVGVYANAETALKAMVTAIPDVILMDINLPGMSGIDAIRVLKRKHPGARILVLTVYEEAKSLFDSLKAGACGYLLKRTPPARIVEAIRDAHAGGVPLNPQMAAKVAQYFHGATGQDKELDRLTDRESETLALLAEGFLYKEIAEKMGISPGTVHQFVKRIYEKLHVHSRTEAVVKYLGR